MGFILIILWLRIFLVLRVLRLAVIASVVVSAYHV